MKKNVSKKMKTSVTVFIALMALVSILLCYLHIINKRIEQSSRSYMTEMLSQSTKSLRNQITSYKTILSNFSTILSTKHTDEIFLSSFRDELDKNATISPFNRLLIADLNGDCYISNTQKINLSQRDYFNNAVSGKTVVSSTISKQQGQYSEISNCATPLYKNGKIDGVLIGTLNLETFKTILNSSFFGDEGRICVIDDKGNNLLSSSLIETQKSGKQKIDTALLNLDDKSKEYIRAEIDEGKTGILIFESDSEVYYSGYSPLFLENWFVSATVNDKVIYTKSIEIRKITIAFLVVFSIFCLGLVLYIVTYQNKIREKLHKSKLELETVIRNIPGGVVRFTSDEELPIFFLNRGLLKLTGYTKWQLETLFDNNFLNLIHKEDCDCLFKSIEKSTQLNQPVQLDCRIKCYDNSYKWFLLRMCIVKDRQDKSSFLCVLTDIDEMKKTQSELKISLQRYDILMQQSDSLIFEYSFVDHSIYLSENWLPMNEYHKQEDFLGYLTRKKTVYPDDVEKFIAIFNDIKNGVKCREENIRLLDNLGKYPWCRLRVSPVFDDNGVIHKAIGKIRNINVEKLENDKLKEDAEVDSLTSLYNKGTTKVLIDDFLQNEGKMGKHALLILDIDNFKNVNDTLGHLIGDTVLTDIAKKIKKSVRNSDICGRIGGDEFIVLLKNTPSEAFISTKAQEICENFRSTVTNENQTVEISGSIGIAPYNADAITYTELFVNADTALYISKKSGKNRFSIFNKETAIGENNPPIKIR